MDAVSRMTPLRSNAHKIAVVGVGVGIVVIVAIFVWMFLLRSNLRVLVENASGHAVASVTLRYRGGKVDLLTLKDGERRSVRITPSGESALTVEVINGAGQTRVSRLDIYLEPSQRGKVELRVQEDNSVSITKEDLRYLPF